MREIVKKIRNNEYLYYQHRVKIDNNSKIITTPIGRADLKEDELNSRRREALRVIIKDYGILNMKITEN
jgi:hypothetical protein